MTEGTRDSRRIAAKQLDAKVVRAEEAGTKYRKALVALAALATAAILATMVLVIVVVLQGPARTKQTQSLIIGQRAQIRVLQKDLNERTAEQKSILDQIGRSGDIVEKALLTYIRDLLIAVEHHVPVLSVPLPPSLK